MKLIDVDLLEKEIYKWMPKDQETWMESEIPPIENLVVSIMMTIQEQPTVDAIPIEWLRNHMITHDEVVNGDYYADEAMELNLYVSDLIEKWYAEGTDNE